MRTAALMFLFGVLCLVALPTLPSFAWLCLVFFCLVVLCFIFFIFNKINNNINKKFFWVIIFFVLGFFYADFRASLILAWQLPHEIENKKITISGYIIDLPVTVEPQTKFIFLTNKIEDKKVKVKIKLTWRDCQQVLHAGDYLQLQVKLKRIHGLMNPGSSDYSKLAFLANIRAQGYVLSGHNNPAPFALRSDLRVSKGEQITHNFFVAPINQFREFLKEKIQNSFVKSKVKINNSGSILALAIGDRSLLTANQWKIMRDTGTNHLMAIAGLHIGFIAGLFFWLIRLIWRQFPSACLFLPSEQVAAIGALIAGLIYALMSGFALPAQRAIMMLTIFLLAIILRRKLAIAHGFFLALFLVLILNPFSVLSDSFWLSFISVGFIILSINRGSSNKNLLIKLTKIQLIMAFGLIPLTIILFQQYSLVAFFTNSLAVPWMGFVLLPIILLGLINLIFSTKIAGLFFWLADKNLIGLWWLLEKFSHYSFAVVPQVIPNYWSVLLVVVGLFLFFLSKKYVFKLISLILFLPLLLFSPAKPKTDQVKLTVLEVGQGLASVIQTNNHVLVFDAGPSFGANYDLGESVVTPFLRSLGVNEIDLLVISHGDNDHAGGANALTKNFSIKKIQSGEPERLHLAKNILPCWRGENWRWDGVDFKFLFPDKNNLAKSNDHSCVLKITNKYHKTILLTGDIERRAEKFLIQNEKNLSADILIAPHHGSKTSGLNDFILAVHPKSVVFSVGYLNKYHFPNALVVAKYQTIKTKIFNTEQDGAISFVLNNNIIVQSYKKSHRHFWQN